MACIAPELVNLIARGFNERGHPEKWRQTQGFAQNVGMGGADGRDAPCLPAMLGGNNLIKVHVA
jgi:hypothetical protein